MRRTFSIYWRLISVNIRGQMQYRVSFLMDAIATGLSAVFEFGALALVLQRFNNIAGWTLPEVAFLYGSVEIAFGTMDLVFSGFDPKFFGRQVRLGSFDQILLRPINVTVQVLTLDIAMRRLGRISVGTVIFATAVYQLNIGWTLPKLGLTAVMLISMVLFFGGLFIIGATISFWTVNSIEAMNVLTYGGSFVTSHPMHIYQPWLRRFFTFVVPVIFLNYFPALYILEKPDPFNMPVWTPLLSPVAGLFMLSLALAFWRFGIRHYQSTGT
jgi:ABC-2 type transport system permease protein